MLTRARSLAEYIMDDLPELSDQELLDVEHAVNLLILRRRVDIFTASRPARPVCLEAGPRLTPSPLKEPAKTGKYGPTHRGGYLPPRLFPWAVTLVGAVLFVVGMVALIGIRVTP